MTSLNNAQSCARRHDDSSVVFAVLLGFIAGYCLRFYRIILVILLLQPFFFANFGVYPGLPLLVFPVMSRSKCLGINRTSQPSSATPGKRSWRKHAEAEADVKRVTPNPERVCFILNQKR